MLRKRPARNRTAPATGGSRPFEGAGCETKWPEVIGCRIVRKSRPAQTYRIETVAGGGAGGPAIEAKLESPQGIAVDAAGKIFVADRINNRLRRIDSAGIIATFAGSGERRPAGDGVPATDRSVLEPAGVAVDRHGNVYIAETGGNRVRKVDRSGIISTVAGTGEAGFGGDGGAATGAMLHRPSGVAPDSAGNVDVADNFNHRVRVIDTDGTIRTVAGTGFGGSDREGAIATQSDLFHPSHVAIDLRGNLYIAERSRISKADPSGTIRTFEAPGPLIGGRLTLGPRVVAADSQGSVYFTKPDFSGISKVDVSGAVTPVLDIPQNEYFPEGLAVDVSGTAFFSDRRSNRIYRVDPGGTAFSIAGLGFRRYTSEGGPATDAKLQFPQSVAVDPLGTLYLHDGSPDPKGGCVGNDSNRGGKRVGSVRLEWPAGGPPPADRRHLGCWGQYLSGIQVVCGERLEF